MRSRIVLQLLFLAALPLFAHAKPDSWTEIRTPHFLVLSNSSEKQARHVADQLERMRLVFQKLLPKAPTDTSMPIAVLAVKNKKDFQALEPAANLAKGQ